MAPRIHPSAEAAQRAEATDLVAVIERVVADGWKALSRTDDGYVSDVVRRRDIAVLVARRTGLGVLEGALREAGVPYRVEGGTLAYDEAEHRVLPHIHVTVGLKQHSAAGHTSHLLRASVQFLTEMLLIEVTAPQIRRQANPDLYDVPLLRFPTSDPG